MPELKCTVQTCVHNKNFLCDLDKIQVGGQRASMAAETSCDSFQKKGADSYTDSLSEDSRTASPYSSVDCKATDCMYNKNCQCEAERINVEGDHACRCDGAECATFQHR